MKTISVRSSRLAAIGIFLLALLAPGARSQVHGAGRSAVVQGTVSDSELSPLKDADVSLESADHAHKFVTRSDAHGRYLFARVPPGSYTLHGSKTGYLEGDHRPFVLSADESKIVDVRLSKAGSASAATQAFSVGQFSDEPHFQIAGIADPNSYGGHGSETALRTKEALAKDTDSLSRETSTQPGGHSATGKAAAEMHRQRGDAAEKEGHGLEEGERIEISGWTEKLHRFSLLDPDNPLAHYYYAVALSNRSQEPAEDSAMEGELKRAIALDPKLGAAYLQLGRLYAARKDHPAAIAAFEKAIANLALPDEAHYRLAQVYRQMGDPNKARQEIALYKQTSQKRTRQEQERRQEIQQFVYTLGGQKPNAPSLDAKPR